MQNEKTGKPSDRTVDCGLAAMAFCETLPDGAAGRHIGDQLLRSATSVAANYAEASEAESLPDFIRKLRLAQKELKESRVWLLFASRLVPGFSPWGCCCMRHWSGFACIQCVSQDEMHNDCIWNADITSVDPSSMMLG